VEFSGEIQASLTEECSRQSTSLGLVVRRLMRAARPLNEWRRGMVDERRIRHGVTVEAWRVQDFMNSNGRLVRRSSAMLRDQSVSENGLGGPWFPVSARFTSVHWRDQRRERRIASQRSERIVGVPFEHPPANPRRDPQQRHRVILAIQRRQNRGTPIRWLEIPTRH
jgi:hypothetical protein